MASLPGTPCNPHGDPPIYGDCWYNCTVDDISREDKRHRLRKVSHYKINSRRLLCEACFEMTIKTSSGMKL